ncbi:MAG: hypothetical protein WKF89_06575 [Chitinophagaceae bacterium]
MDKEKIHDCACKGDPEQPSSGALRNANYRPIDLSFQPKRRSSFEQMHVTRFELKSPEVDATPEGHEISTKAHKMLPIVNCNCALLK